MNIVFNGRVFELETPCDLSTLLENPDINQGLPLAQAVVALNQTFIHRDDYCNYQLKDNDEIEMLTAVVGG